MRIKHTIGYAGVALFMSMVLVAPSIVYGLESTSTSYEIHGSAVESISGNGSSTTYQARNAGGQNSTGISSNIKKVYSGVLYWLTGLFTAQYNQIHYRWRNDDGSEVTATFAANEDSQYLNFPKNTVKRLRLEVSNTGWTRGAGQQYRLEYAATATCSSGTYSAVPINTTSSAWMIATSSNVTDAQATTNVAGGLTDANSIFVAGQVKSTGNTTAAITLTSEQFTEIEYVLVANVSSNGPYCFRVTNNGVTTNFAYTQYAMATIQTGLPPTGDLTSSIFDTGVAGGVAYNSIMWLGTAGTGKVRLQLATSNSTSGPWSFIGSDGVSCGTSYFYDSGTAPNGGPNVPVELICAPQNHNNQRYYQYRVQLCSATDCTSAGATSPVVNDVIVNWAP